MNAPRDETGHSSPKPKKTNKEYHPTESVVPLSKIAIALETLWADICYIKDDAVRDAAWKTHTNHHSLCPKELGPNFIQSWTHAKTGYGTIEMMMAPLAEQSSVVSLNSKINDNLAKVLHKLQDDVGTDNRVHAHFDKENHKHSALFTAEAPVVDPSGKLSRIVFLCYNRSSTLHSEAAKSRKEPVVKAIEAALEGVHPGLKSPSFRGYGNLIGSQGLLLCIDKENRTIIQIAAMSPASLNKPSTFISPVVSMFHRLHSRKPLDLFQFACLSIIAMSVNKTFPLLTILSTWLDDGLPEGNLFYQHEMKAKELFGGHSCGPKQRCAPFKNTPWTKKEIDHKVRLVANLLKRELRRQTASNTMDVLPRKPSQSLLQLEAERLIRELMKMKHFKTLACQHGTYIFNFCGVGHPKMMYQTGQSENSAIYKEHSGLSSSDKLSVLMITADRLQLPVSSIESSCEYMRTDHKVDILTPNCPILGNPQCTDMGSSFFQHFLPEDDTWEPLESDVFNLISTDLDKRLLETNVHESIDVIGDEEAKKLAKKRHEILEMPGEDSVGYRNIISAITKRVPGESQQDTMKRCCQAAKQHYGCDPSNVYKMKTAKASIMALALAHASKSTSSVTTNLSDVGTPTSNATRNNVTPRIVTPPCKKLSYGFSEGPRLTKLKKNPV